jgi:hypothetical protein
LATYGNETIYYGRKQGWDVFPERLRLSDGTALPTKVSSGFPNQPRMFLGGWGVPAFSEGRILFGSGHWFYALSASGPSKGRAFYDGGSVLPIASGPYAVSQGWYWSAQAFRFEDHQMRRVWEKRAARDNAHCWIPVGPYGSALLQENWNGGGAWGLGLFDLSSGYAFWHARTTVKGLAVSAGMQIVAEEEDPRSPGPAGQSILTVRDGRSGKRLWQSRSLAGHPLAASKGQLFVASSGGQLHCLQ